tara:strand:- start:1416 stop:1835 length:420 start_codon:yes stop_codon:yes gene_type:complete
MGNWTTVHISGTCNAGDVPALKAAVNTGDDWDAFHCLCNSGGLCGLGDWVCEEMSVIGNLAERDYGAEDVAAQLREFAKIAPSLNLKVHVGGAYESLDCVATVNCIDGAVTINDAEIKTLASIPQAQIQANLMSALTGR